MLPTDEGITRDEIVELGKNIDMLLDVVGATDQSKRNVIKSDMITEMNIYEALYGYEGAITTNGLTMNVMYGTESTTMGNKMYRLVFSDIIFE